MQTSIHVQSPKTSSRLGISSLLAVVMTSGKSKMSLRSMYYGAGAYSGMGMVDPSCMGSGRGTGHEVVTVHGCISACLGLVLPSKTSSSNGAIGKCSSTSSSLVTSWKESSVRWCEDCSVLPWSGLLSVEELSSSSNVKWWHMELRLLC